MNTKNNCIYVNIVIVSYSSHLKCQQQQNTNQASLYNVIYLRNKLFQTCSKIENIPYDLFLQQNLMIPLL